MNDIPLLWGQMRTVWDAMVKQSRINTLTNYGLCGILGLILVDIYFTHVLNEKISDLEARIVQLEAKP